MTQMKIKGVGKLRVNLKKMGPQNGTVRRIVKTNGILSGDELAAEMRIDNGTLMYVVDEIVRIVKAGYEVRLGKSEEDCFRFFPILDKECKKMMLVAQSCGNLRSSVEKLDFDIYRGGEVLGSEGVEEIVKSVSKEHEKCISVTPDQMVSCPKCGARFRVGKALAQG